MIGIALEGGAERCAFTAGVLDQMMTYHLEVAAISGTSAGAGCALSFCSGQRGISLQMMLPQKQDRYFGVSHMLKNGNFLDLEHMVELYSRYIDFSALFSSTMQIDFAATCCETGMPTYLSAKKNRANLQKALMASCALPIICKPIVLKNQHYVDGSIVAPIPFSHLLEIGCDKVIVIYTGTATCRPTDYHKFKPLLRRCYLKSYPTLYHAIINRIDCYRTHVQQMEQAQKNGQIFILRPQIPAIPLFTQDSKKIYGYYQHGQALLQQLWPTIYNWLQEEPVLSFKKAENSIPFACPILR